MKTQDMRKQKQRQEKLIVKMLPKFIVAKVMAGETTAETFDHATLYFSTVDGFTHVQQNCT